MIRTLSTLLPLLLLPACSSTPFQQTNGTSSPAVAPLVGAAVGAGSASLMKLSKPLIALAGIGGAGLGYYVTTLHFDSTGIAQAGGQVYTVGDYVTIDIPSDNLFDVNSSDFLPQAQSTLESVVTVLNRYPCHNIIIAGNTSGFNTDKSEQKLSENRARQIAAFLWSHGIPGDQEDNQRRLIYVGYDNYLPIANTITAKGIRTNSHIQITASPPDAKVMDEGVFKVFRNIGAFDESTNKEAK